MNIAEEVRILVEDRNLTEALYEAATKTAREILAADTTPGMEAGDLATEFILWLSGQSGLNIRSHKALRLQMRRFWIRRNAPAAYELWEVLSTALHSLAKRGAVRRLDAPHETPNHNAAIWTSAPEERDEARLDHRGFLERAKALPRYPRSGKRPKNAKILQPKEAEELALGLLKAAAVPAPMEVISKEAQQHVILPEIVEAPEEGDSEDDAPKGPPPPAAPDRPSIVADELLLVREAEHLAALLWDDPQCGRLSTNRVRELLCGFLVPNLLEDGGVPQGNFGSPQRVSEDLKEIYACLKRFTGFVETGDAPGPRHDPEEADNRRWVLENILLRALMILQESRCPEASD
jgi:hypothetical protein